MNAASKSTATPSIDAANSPHTDTLLDVSITPRHGATRGTFDVIDLKTGDVLANGTAPFCERFRLEVLQQRVGGDRLKLVLPTFGGKQFWKDVFVHCGWRIQEHLGSRWCRLLDRRNRSRAYGSFQECRVIFEERRLKRRLAPQSRHAVVLLHGLVRAKESMGALEETFSRVGYEVININYPSTRQPLRLHAQQLNLVLERVRDIDTVSFVTHSMGGIVVRLALATAQWTERINVHRLLMICPPNQGAEIADRWKDNPLMRLLEGPSLKELTPAALESLPAPECPFAIIAGARDRTVKVFEAILPNAEYIRVMDIEHTFSMVEPQVIDAAVRYLNGGSLYTSDLNTIPKTSMEELKVRLKSAVEAEIVRLVDPDAASLKLEELVESRGQSMAHTSFALGVQFDKEVTDVTSELTATVSARRQSASPTTSVLLDEILRDSVEGGEALKLELANNLSIIEAEGLEELEALVEHTREARATVVEHATRRIRLLEEGAMAALNAADADHREVSLQVERTIALIHKSPATRTDDVDRQGRRRILIAAKSTMRDLKSAQGDAYAGLWQLRADACAEMDGLESGAGPGASIQELQRRLKERFDASQASLTGKLEGARRDLQSALKDEIGARIGLESERGRELREFGEGAIDELQAQAIKKMERDVERALRRLRFPIDKVRTHLEAGGPPKHLQDLVDRVLERFDPTIEDTERRLRSRIAATRQIVHTELNELEG